jgi:hypothetical protein
MGAADAAVTPIFMAVARASAPANGTMIFLFIFHSIHIALARGESVQKKARGSAIRSGSEAVNSCKVNDVRLTGGVPKSRRKDRDEVAAVSGEPAGDLQFKQKRANFGGGTLHRRTRSSMLTGAGPSSETSFARVSSLG